MCAVPCYSFMMLVTGAFFPFISSNFSINLPDIFTFYLLKEPKFSCVDLLLPVIIFIAFFYFVKVYLLLIMNASFINFQPLFFIDFFLPVVLSVTERDMIKSWVSYFGVTFSSSSREMCVQVFYMTIVLSGSSFGSLIVYVFL